MRRLVATFVRLRWRLWRGAIRHGGAEQVGAVVSTIASAVLGLGIGAAVMTAGRSSEHPADFAVLFCSLLLLAVVGFGIVAGISQPIDPRVIAAEPLSDRDRSIGLLAAAASGPPGLAGVAIGIGLGIGMTRSVAQVPLVALAIAAWLLSLLLVARTVTNLLALFTSRFPRAGQMVVGLSGLLFYGVFQIIPALLGRLDTAGRARFADGLAWTPPGQVGRALADDGRGWVHLLAAGVWLPALAVAFVWSARELSLSVRRSGGLDTSSAERGPIGRLARRWCGDGPEGAIAWRSILIRFRTPRTALETFTGAGVGMAAVLVPAIVRDGAGSGAVLVGGAVQLAVLFMADEWRYLIAGIGVGIGGLLAGTGAAVVQSAMVPIAIPDSDNPFAGGESGKGIVAALLLGVVLACLAIVTVPVALALFWATDRGLVALVTVFGALTVVVGWAILRFGVRIATHRVVGREPEFISAVTPAR